MIIKHLEASCWFLMSFFFNWILQAGRAHRHHGAVRCLWGRFPETCMKMSLFLCLREQASCMSSDWWWSSLEKTVVMPLSCIPTSKVQLEWFELCNCLSVWIHNQKYFVQGGSAESHPDVGQLQSTPGKVHWCVCESGQLPPFYWLHPQGEDERRGHGRDEKGSHLGFDS